MVDRPVQIMRTKNLYYNPIKYLASLLYLAALGLVACEVHVTLQGSEILLLEKLVPVQVVHVFFAVQHSGVN